MDTTVARKMRMQNCAIMARWICPTVKRATEALVCLALLLGTAYVQALPPGVVIDHQPAPTEQYIGSPSIAILPNGNYVASHDLFGPKATHTVSAVTKVFLSSDRGQTWKQLAELHDQFWSTLFVLHKTLYLMGTNYEYGRVTIRRSVDNGRTWSVPSYLTEPGYHTAPVPVAISAGRIWRAFEYHPDGPWGSFRAFLMSAPQNADLLKAESWSRSIPLSFPSTIKDATTWLEGNAVVGPDGILEDVLRIANLERVAITEQQGNTLKFDKLVDFPGGAKKFTIRYDSSSKRYWTLSNKAPTSEERSEKDPGSVRNLLCLMSSTDLQHWTVERTILYHPGWARYGFQYVDWQFDGSDIVAVSRTAFDDEFGGANRAHDANYLTFHRVADFRSNPNRDR